MQSSLEYGDYEYTHPDEDSIMDIFGRKKIRELEETIVQTLRTVANMQRDIQELQKSCYITKYPPKYPRAPSSYSVKYPVSDVLDLLLEHFELIPKKEHKVERLVLEKAHYQQTYSFYTEEQQRSKS